MGGKITSNKEGYTMSKKPTGSGGPMPKPVPKPKPSARKGK